MNEQHHEPIPNRMLAGAILAILILTALASGATISIEGPADVEAGKPAWFSISAPDGYDVSFFPSQELQCDLEKVRQGVGMFWSDKPGVYMIFACVINWDQKLFRPLSKTVVVKGDTTPEPNPIPTPTPGTVNWVCLLSESADVTPTQATAMFALEQYAKSRKHQWHREDPSSSKQPWVKPLYAQTGAAGLKLPVLIVGACSDGDDAPKSVTIKALAADPVAQLKGLGG